MTTTRKKASRVPGSVEAIVARLESLQNVENQAKIRRFGIRPNTRLLGISITQLRELEREYQHSHDLAIDLWGSEIHEARLLASLLDLPSAVSLAQMDTWVNDFDAWDICDQTCQNLFRHTPYIEEKCKEWMTSSEEFVKRAGFVLVAQSATSGSLTDAQLIDSFPFLFAGMTDPRNFVKKAVSWSFRQIGKRRMPLRSAVLQAVSPLVESDDKTVRWIAKDVCKELNDPKIIARLKSKDPA